MDRSRMEEVQLYLQLYDRDVISAKTLLKKVGIDPTEEKKNMDGEIRVVPTCSKVG